MRGAFFDFDGTIIKGMSSIRFCEFLLQKGTSFLKLQEVILLLKVVYDENIENSPKSYEDLDKLWENDIPDFNIETLNEAAKEFFENEVQNLKKEIVDIIDNHIKNNDYLVMFSTAPAGLVKLFAERLKFNEVHGTEVAILEGKYRGIKKPFLIGEIRANIVKETAEKQKIDLSDSYAYGNSIFDLKMLEMVGHPICVSPDKRLRAIAMERNWKILDV